MASPVKLQGVGPGGFQGSTFVPGSIIDASAFGGDTDAGHRLVHARSARCTWDGNQTVNDGEAIYVLASQNATTAQVARASSPRGFKASIDGFDIRGGDQQGFPGNINDLTGGPTGLPPSIVTQGGAIFANAYARYLQITNNVVQNNGGGYGTIRIGTPDLAGAGHQPAQRERPDRQQPDHRERRHQPGRRHRDLRGSDSYEVAAQRHLRQLLARVRRRPQRLRPEPERQDPPQPHLPQQVQRRGRRHHDRRRSCRPTPARSRPAPARWTSTPTRSRPTSPTTTAAASGS